MARGLVLRVRWAADAHSACPRYRRRKIMSEKIEHHLENAEHAQHHAHDPFDRRVAMTMSIVAAVLAGVTLVSHRGHTETLRLATEADTNHTKASDQWNLYQAKNIRAHEYEAFLF